jgi:hypothetical protein
MEHKTFSVRLPEDVIEEMRALAKEHTRSLNSEVLVALREYIKQQRQGLKPKSPHPLPEGQGLAEG